MEQWDREVDVLVVGTGAAGLTAAITAADAGLEVLVLESTDKWGGSTNLSGGGLWMPTNPLMPESSDSVDEALAYLDACVGDVGPASSPERRRAFVETVPEAMRFLEGLGVRWVSAKDYPDYYPDLPGGKIGRAVEVEPFDVSVLGDWFDRSRSSEGLPPIPVMTDDVWLLARAWSTITGFIRGVQLVLRTAAMAVRGERRQGMGSGLVASLMHIVRTQGTEVLLEAPLAELVTDDEGAVVGGVARRRDGFALRIRARRGVVLGAGGFAHNERLRKEHHGIPAGWSSAADGDVGSVIELAADLGARLELMDDAWWGLSVPDPRGGKPMFILAERSLPHGLIVDQQGDRYLNESTSYVDVGHAMLARDAEVPAIPSWLIVDARHRRRYLFTAFLEGTKHLEAAGVVRTADTIDGLAEALDMDPTRLRATIDRFNGFARAGIDEDFGRGATAYDRYYSDPTVRPNPNLGTVEQGPFTAVQLVPGDLGTKGGVLTDEDGRVLRDDLSPIPGLYASGNTSASVMGRTYPGAGSTIGPAVVFSYRAGRHLAARETAQQATD